MRLTSAPPLPAPAPGPRPNKLLSCSSSTATPHLRGARRQHDGRRRTDSSRQGRSREGPRGSVRGWLGTAAPGRRVMHARVPQSALCAHVGGALSIGPPLLVHLRLGRWPRDSARAVARHCHRSEGARAPRSALRDARAHAPQSAFCDAWAGTLGIGFPLLASSRETRHARPRAAVSILRAWGRLSPLLAYRHQRQRTDIVRTRSPQPHDRHYGRRQRRMTQHWHAAEMRCRRPSGAAPRARARRRAGHLYLPVWVQTHRTLMHRTCTHLTHTYSMRPITPHKSTHGLSQSDLSSETTWVSA